MEKIANIIFSDFMDTLIGPDDGLSPKESCQVLQKFLLNYLVKDNYFVIITSSDHFLPQEFVGYLKDSTYLLSDSHKNKLFYFMTEINEIYMDGIPILSDTINCIEVDGFRINVLNEKKIAAVDLALNSIFKNYKIKKLLAAGDSYQDIDMLAKIHDMGGQSFLFPTNGLNYYEKLMNYSIEELFMKIISGESMDYYRESFDNLERGIVTELDVKHEEWRKSRWQELTTLYQEGSLTKEQLVELVMKYTETQMYEAEVNLSPFPEKFEKEITYKEAANIISKKMVLIKDRREIFNIFNSVMR